MYGGYGNIWSQGTAQWTPGNVQNQNNFPVQNQNQFPVQNQNQQNGNQGFPNQQGMMGYGNMGNVGNQNPGGAGMMNYMGMGQNPFMNYGGFGMGAGYGMQAASANTAGWMPGQQFQLRPTFAGSRPPLPPGPPPPDTPQVQPQNPFNIPNQQSIPTTTANSSINQQPPPPPPPPPPTTQADTNDLVLSKGKLVSTGSTLPGTSMNLEDAYNIIKNAAAYGMLPSSNPLAPVPEKLNVSEELFGSKKDDKGIPGLDMVEEDKPPTPAGPEVVDLEIDQSRSFLTTSETQKTDTNKVPNGGTTAGAQKEVVWELRNDAKEENPQATKSAGENGGNSGWSTWKNNIQKTEGNDKVLRDGGGPAPTEKNLTKEPKQEPEKSIKTNSDSGNGVKIQLEPVDGKEVVYDRKTLKQFDSKFREWENQFEEWKRSNQNHPDKNAYSKYLSQWTSWRDQLIEQRRSILDKMTRAKLECKELLMAKFDCLDANGTNEETSSENFKNNDQHKSDTSFSEDRFPEDIIDNRTENPFESALNNVSGASRKPFSASATQISNNNGHQNKQDPLPNRSNIPPLMPGLGAAVDKGKDRPVERILRAGGGGKRDDRSTFENEFQPPPGENPFSTNFENNKIGHRNEEPRTRTSRFDSDKSADVSLPFEWTLPSQNEKNPFEVAQQATNPFASNQGQNPFEVAQQSRLPSLNDYIQKTNLDFQSSSKASSANPFVMPSMSSNEQSNPRDVQFERIPRDPGAAKAKPNPTPVPLRLEANPSGFPLFVAAKEQERRQNDDFSQMFSRDRGPSVDAHNSLQFDADDDFVEDAEVIDYGAGVAENSVDSMDFPRGENPEENEGGDDPDFSLEDSEVIDYSQGLPPDAGQPGFHGNEPYGGYDESFSQGYHEHAIRGRGRGFAGGWNRGNARGAHTMGRGAPPQYPQEQFGPSRGRGMFRGAGRGIRGPPPPQEWFQHDDRESQFQQPHNHGSPEIVEIHDSPEASDVPLGVKIAPPNPDFERGDRRRSRERYPRERSRSRSNERGSRRRYDDRRDRDRRSPERRSRFDDRDDRRDRDRGRDRRGRSRSPLDERGPGIVVRNPLFPSASAGMLGVNSASNPPAPRYQTVLIEDILNTPGRLKRPSRLVIFMRGLPGSGKSHIVKLIKEREVEMGGKAPRILSLDNYFITELEKMEKDPVSGVEVKKTVMEYEYDEEREPLYRAQLVRQFKKTLDEGYFSFVIVDCVNEFVRQFEEMANVATQKRFQVYVAETEETVDICVKRNTHRRTRDEILKISRNWERTPGNFVKLDTRTLLQDEAIQEVEMEDVSDVEADNCEKEEQKSLTPAERGKIGPQIVDLEDIGSDEDSGDQDQMSSKWDKLEPSQEKLRKLDGLMKKKRANNDDDAHVESAPSIENWLQSHMPEDYAYRRPEQDGQKRVRWADIEEKREQERMREVGFVVGHTDWKRMMDPTGGSSALTKTKFF